MPPVRSCRHFDDVVFVIPRYAELFGLVMHTMDKLDCIVIGAGVVGLAIARSLAQKGRKVIILERESQFGSVTSSRNSEVIHAGIYYPADSLKAALCVRGRNMLYDFCARYRVPYRRCGKMIVATNDCQQSELRAIQLTAHANGVDDLQLIAGDRAQRLEPALACRAALLSPSTGIIDVHSYMVALLGQAEANGAILVCRTPVERLRAEGDGIVVVTAGIDAAVLKANCVINSAGLDAPALASVTEGLSSKHRPTAYFAKGSYFTLSGRAPFSRLIYPVPESDGLGIHLTLDLGGQARFGPDTEWVDTPDYQVDRRRVDTFYRAIRRYWPQLRDGSLEPGYAGVRPKIVTCGEPSADFRIDGPCEHGVPGLINVFGIESPGLTASLAIADVVTELAADKTR